MTLGLRLRLGLRTGLRRSSLLYWSATLSVAAATGITVSHQVAEASARAERLGGLRQVPVAARPLAAGEVLASADVSVRRLPTAAIPEGPVSLSPAGRPALVDLAAGEVLLAAKLAPEGVRGVAALLPAGMRALAVPVEAGGLDLERGHHVEVLATFDTEATEAGEPTFPVATGAVVIDAGEESVTIAVSPDEAPRVAFALARGSVTLALSPFEDITPK
ncbi:MAG: SAF domain-containing protein, partial [Acidimicrobiales bacterium]